MSTLYSITSPKSNADALAPAIPLPLPLSPSLPHPVPLSHLPADTSTVLQPPLPVLSERALTLSSARDHQEEDDDRRSDLQRVY